MSVGVIPATIAAQPTGALQLLYENTFSAVATADITTRNVPRQSGAIFQSDYDEYIISIINLIPSVDSNIGMRVSQDGGATWETTNYQYGLPWGNQNGITGITNGASVSYYNVGMGTVEATASPGTCVTIKLWNPRGSTLKQISSHDGISYLNDANRYGFSGGGEWSNTATYNAVRFLSITAGTISGTFRIYGIAKSSTAGVGPNILTGKVVQQVYTETGATATGTTIIPLDDTIPQNTEGDEYMTLAITPTNASNRLKIDVVIYLLTTAASGWVSAALFQDSNANALAAGPSFTQVATATFPIVFTHHMAAGTTSATTFKVRAGGNLAGTTRMNGISTGRVYGGVVASSITITEIVP